MLGGFFGVGKIRHQLHFHFLRRDELANNEAPRITSIDAYRGLVMFLMVAAGMALYNVPKHDQFAETISGKPEWVRTVWQTVAFHTNHVKWGGCSLHDMIQPSFSFLVGVALPFSLASRQAKGQGRADALPRRPGPVAHRARASSCGPREDQTNFTFEDTLSQIGLGTCSCFARFARPPAVDGVRPRSWSATGRCSPCIRCRPRSSTTGRRRAGRLAAPLPGFAAHWNKNTNLAWRFDLWFLNLFGRDKPFEYNGGGYATLSFIPTLATMILGLIAGTWMKGRGAVGRPCGCGCS